MLGSGRERYATRTRVCLELRTSWPRMTAWVMCSFARGSAQHSAFFERPDVVERVAEPGQHVGVVLAQAWRHAPHARTRAVPLDGQPDRPVVGAARMRRSDHHATLVRLRLLRHLLAAQARRA